MLKFLQTNWKTLSSCVGLCIVMFATGVTVGQRQGFVMGLDFFFNQCYNIGGVVLDERGYAIECKPLGPVPKEELQGLDKKQDMWYNKTINSL